MDLQWKHPPLHDANLPRPQVTLPYFSLAMWIDFPMEVWKSRWKNITVPICSEHTMPSLPICFDLNPIGSWQKKNAAKSSVEKWYQWTLETSKCPMQVGILKNITMPLCSEHTMPSLPICFDLNQIGSWQKNNAAKSSVEWYQWTLETS